MICSLYIPEVARCRYARLLTPHVCEIILLLKVKEKMDSPIFLIKECFPKGGSGIVAKLFSIKHQNFHLTSKSKRPTRTSYCRERNEVGILKKNGLFASSLHNKDDSDSGSDDDNENMRELVCSILNDDVQTMKQLIKDNIDVNRKIAFGKITRVLQDKESQDCVDYYASKSKKRIDFSLLGEYDDMEKSKHSPFRYCIIYKRLNTLSFLSSLDQVSEAKVASYLKDCDEDCKKHIMLGLKKRLEKKYKEATIHLGRYHNSDTLMFLVSSELDKEGKPETIAGVRVDIVNSVSSKFNYENVDIEKKEKRLDDQTVILLQNARRACEDKLYESHSNINVISISSINTRNTNVGEQPTFEPCIVIYCSNMGFIPDGEEHFPKYVEHNGVKIPLDVRGCNSIPVMTVGNYKQGGPRRIRMGYRIHRNGKNRQGSIGPFVQRHYQQVEFLTCAHVLFDIGNNIGQLSLDADKTKNNVLHGKSCGNGNHIHSSSENVCGLLQTGFFRPDCGVDIAVVQITESCTPLEGKFREIEHEQSQNIELEAPVLFNSGRIVSKDDIRNFIARSMKESDNPIIIGNSSTPRTSIGRLHQDGVLVSTRLEFNGVKHVMKDVYRVVSYKNPFIEFGDSGSAVFVKRDNELQCIGIALSQGDNGMSGFVTPIDSVLDIVGDDCKLKTFYTSRHTLPSANKKLKLTRNQSK